jgi:hypothetical protein
MPVTVTAVPPVNGPPSGKSCRTWQAAMLCPPVLPSKWCSPVLPTKYGRGMSGGGVAGGAVGGSDGGSAGGRSGGSLGGKEGEVMLPLTEATTSARATDESSSCRQAAIGE